MRGRAIIFAAASVWASLSAPAAAHPHIFIDTGLEFLFDADGRVTAVKVAWVYDDFTSMLLLGDRALDPDGDGKLTQDEEAQLSGFDMAWDADYAGDLYLLDGEDGTPVALGRPKDWSARVFDGRIISTHIRPLEAPLAVADRPLVAQVYDPTYYTSYTILGTPVLSGRDGCTVGVFEPDLGEAERVLREALAEYTADQSALVEQDFPHVGAVFAEEARVTCGGG
jgi:polyphosphate kinase